MKKTLFVILLALIIIGRVVDHPANFAPVTAVILFGTALLGIRATLPLALLGMIATDAVIGFYDWRLMAAVYGSFGLIAFAARWLNTRQSVFEILGTSVFSSLLFFFFTNAMVWYITPYYAKTTSGLAEAYILGLPFFRMTLLGDLFYTVSLFGLAWAAITIKNRLVFSYPVKNR